MATPTPSQLTAATTCWGSSSVTHRCRTAWRPGPPTTAATSSRRSTGQLRAWPSRAGQGATTAPTSSCGRSPLGVTGGLGRPRQASRASSTPPTRCSTSSTTTAGPDRTAAPRSADGERGVDDRLLLLHVDGVRPGGGAARLVAADPHDLVSGGEALGQAVLREGPGAHVRRLLLQPDHLAGVGVADRHLGQAVVGPRV